MTTSKRQLWRRAQVNLFLQEQIFLLSLNGPRAQVFTSIELMNGIESFFPL